MTRIKAISSVLFVMITACLIYLGQTINAAKPSVSEKVQSISQSNNHFAIDLYRQLRPQEENLFFSPISLSTALAMTYAGAKGDTAREMANVLHFALPEAQIHTAFAALLERLNVPKEKAYELRVANRLWGQRGYGFLPSFLATTRNAYGAEPVQVNFVDAADQARQDINTWVAEQTNNKIKDLVPQGVLNALTRLVLTNAIYFKGKWVHPFDKQETQEAPFTTSAGKRVKVSLMVQQEEFQYGETQKLQLLEMPYIGDDLSMLILLPKQVDGLPALEKELTLENLAQWSSDMRSQEVLTYLPRFKLTERFELRSPLSALGMPSAFKPDQANFSGMNNARNLFLSAVLHQAFVEVNEEGTEAAAATGVVIRATSAQIIPTFRADHPFIFLIREKQSGSILFIGRVANPAK